MLKLSVIVPVYNCEKTLKKCLDSILNQTLKELEIIIINDGSKDRSKFLCREYKEKYKEKINYIERENKGCSASRNQGIKLSKAEYITFVDSDDYIDKEMYKNMYEKAKSNDSDIVVCGYNSVDSDYKLLEKISAPKYKEKHSYFKIENGCFNSPCNKIYKGDFLNKKNLNFPVNTHMGEDMVFNFKAFLFSEKISTVEECYYYYYKNSGSVTQNPLKIKEIYTSLNEIYKFLKEEKKFQEYKKIFLDLFIFHGMEMCYGYIEDLKNSKNSEADILLEISRRNIKKYYKCFNFKQKKNFFYREFRLKFCFFKPIIKKFLSRGV